MIIQAFKIRNCTFPTMQSSHSFDMSAVTRQPVCRSIRDHVRFQTLFNGFWQIYHSVWEKIDWILFRTQAYRHDCQHHTNGAFCGNGYPIAEILRRECDNLLFFFKFGNSSHCFRKSRDKSRLCSIGK